LYLIYLTVALFPHMVPGDGLNKQSYPRADTWREAQSPDTEYSSWPAWRWPD